MKFERLMTTIDAHAEGMPIRLVTGGIPNIPGQTMAEKRDFVKQNLDHLRTFLVYEPRGHTNMFASILTTAVTDEAAFGVVFLSPWGYINMCGHGSMGIATIAVETGMVEAREPVTDILIDTPAGPVRVRVNVKNGKAKSTTLESVPSFLYGTELIKVPDIGELPVDIAYGGNNFAIVEAKDLGITTCVDDVLNSESLLTQIKESVNRQVKVQHPKIDDIKGIEGVLISDSPANPKANVKNVALGPHGNIDRSPCGTGTCARLATQYFKGKLGLGETLATESIIGSIFYAKAVKEVSVGAIRAVVPEVTGSAFITGIHNFVMDEDDPFKYGFRL